MFEPLPLVVQPPDADEAGTVAADAARHWGLAPPTLIRLSSNAIFGSGAVVLRVSRTTAPAELSLALARQLHEVGLRVAVPARDDVYSAGNGVTVTAWRRIVATSAAPDWQQVGAMVRRLHALDPTSIAHPLPFCGDFPWWDFPVLLREVDLLDPDSAEAVRAAYASRAGWYARARSGALVVCHGDVHPGNVLVDRDGPVLIDWDLLCLGPRAWDHAPLMSWTSRWGGADGVYEDFAAGYGETMNDPLAEAICTLRLLAATLMRVRAERGAPPGGEAERRLAFWRGAVDAPQWRAQ